jgi:predicted DsbA family dithiol-disulfide isomerase
MTDAPEIEIDIASDIVCPWCVIGWKQLERALAETGVRGLVRWHPFQLHPEMGPEGEDYRQYIAAKYGLSQDAITENRARLTALGAALGFRFDYFDGMRTYNTFDAHRLLHWADGHSAKHALKMALFAAFFTERQNVSDPEVLADTVAAVGLDRTEAAAVLAGGRHADDVRTMQTVWAQNGVRGVPAMVFQRRHLVTGAQGVERYAAILRQLVGRHAA